MKSRQRILLVCLVFSYVWGVALGNFVHNFLHHISDHHHHHSLPCLVKGLTEVPSDERGLPFRATVSVSDCDLKILLHSLCRPTTSGSSQPEISKIAIHVNPIVLKPTIGLVKEILVSSTSSRGPPIKA